ncbi:MAG: acetylglutamate kinase [Chloroflexi bacterium]|nr:acetylglutamate kinase [Chloroflexota bacterium]
MTAPIVLKIGGNELDTPGFVDELALVVKKIAPVVLVHGGGREISSTQEKFNLTPVYMDGLRVTDEPSLRIAEMVLCGSINPRIVRCLQLNGVEAQGLNGSDRGLLRAKKLEHPKGDLGRVGEVIAVRAEILQALLAQGVTLVIAPISLGDGDVFNVNADYAAGAIAKALNAEKAIFISNVPGVLQDGQVIPTLTPSLAAELIANGVIQKGMIPKVETALEVVKSGVAQVVITNLAGVAAGTGTAIVSH